MGRKRGLSDEQVQRAQFLYHDTKVKISQIAAMLHVSPGPIHNIIERKGAYSDIAPYQKAKEQFSECPVKRKKLPVDKGKLHDAIEVLRDLNDVKIDSALRYLKALRGPNGSV